VEIKNKHYIIGLLAIGILVRVMSFQSGFMFTNDVGLFQFWGQRLHYYGFSQFYYRIHFCDYPPGFLYYLYLVGALSARFGWEILSSTILNFITFMPAMLADLGIGYIIYRVVAYGRLVRPKGEKKSADLHIDVAVRALIMSALWILNPAVILISSVWGQVESVFSIFLLLSLLLLREKKLVASYLLFAVAIIIKAQSLFLAPIYLYSAFAYLMDNLFIKDAAGNKIRVVLWASSDEEATSGNWGHRGAKFALWGRKLHGIKIDSIAWGRLANAILASVVVMILLMLPFSQGFNIMPVVRLYTSGLGTYAFTSVNAFNFWGLIHNVGAGWTHMATPHVVVGVIITITLVIGALYVLFRDHTRFGGRHYFFITGALLALIFIFSVRMHERYLFPALVFFVVYYAQTRQKWGLWIYGALSVTFFFNCTEIIRWLRAGAHGSDVLAVSAPILSFMNVIIGGVILFMLAATKWMAQANPPRTGNKSKHGNQKPSAMVSREKHNNAARTDEPPTIIDPPPMKRRDYAFLLILILVYSIIAFVRLGDTNAPQTSWTPEVGEAAIIDFGEARHIAEFQFRMGAVHGAMFTVETSIDGINWGHFDTISPAHTDAFAWASRHMHVYARFVQIRADMASWYNRFRIQEVGFRGPDRELLPIHGISAGAEALVDEQQWVPLYRSFMNSTYFDEIFHPRAGYEHIHGLRTWENTHPPMGKNFIAMGIRVFGMTPFGWRFSGALFGVLMVPLLYAFARLLLKSNNWGLFAAAIFTFDFMHFAQTRIATIDSHVTLFIIAMYFLMYMFLHGVSRDSLRRKLIILGLCGICVGLAAASKWQGIYAIIGLPVLFLPALYRLYLSDRKQATTIFYACFGFFVAIPLVIYVLSYIPFMVGYHMFQPEGQSWLRTVWNNQVGMYRYHAFLDVDYHPFMSSWWEWPLNLRPIFLYSNSGTAEGTRAAISSFGNPAVWWGGVAAIGFVLFYAMDSGVIKKLTYSFKNAMDMRPSSLDSRDAAIDIHSVLLWVAIVAQLLPWDGWPWILRIAATVYIVGFMVKRKVDSDIYFLLIAFWAQFLPWVGITRLTWIYHFFPSVPFIVLFVAWVFKRYIKKPIMAIGYVALVIALFALFYPVLSGLPISVDFVRTYLQWLPRWHLI